MLQSGLRIVFYLSEDQAETKNLATGQAGRLARMKRDYAVWRKDVFAGGA